ncbi:amino acid adenylation domain-containing protein [Longispora sp. K20-0274]|uniref:non-ribosomal peptide synthetase n=1 Tax=Longispora sp. K20-0274 TaxID=3088255 RepID=UPI00399BDA04
MTRIPSWTTAPDAPSGTVRVPLPAGLSAAAEGFGVAVQVLSLAALARVTGVLAAENRITIGYAASGTVSATVGGVTWRELVAQLHTQVEGAAGGVSSVPVEVGFGGVPGAALAVDLEAGDLVVRHDPRVADAEHAARIAGYLRTALGALVADPDAPVEGTDLLSAAERHHQLRERGGEVRELPTERFHELFARRAAEHPDRTAVVHSGVTYSYGWLNAAANQIAHALLSHGLRPEEVVMTATERTPHWLAAIIGILKAGGAYLPTEPGYPAPRVTTVREQSGCRLVLTEPDVDGNPEYAGLAEALREPGVVALPIADLLAAGHPTTDPDVAVGLDQLAYIYFTSGSTGRPKGAMCTHHGMINHLVAKIVDFGIDADSRVVQKAQQTFDISLWQLIAPLLTGGSTLIVTRDEILDVRRFLATVSTGGATVVQVVPSYLDVLLRIAEDGAERVDLGAVRYISATGEALNKTLVTRWFAQFPGIRLVNAYGATEASDDTNHEIMSQVPSEELTPVGRPVTNVVVYILGPDDTLVPLGTPGEIVVSGVCVGRGYVNDPDRTALAFGDDPFRPGERIYRTGDFGRWLPSGSVEFHGRRDEQVKVNGIRIELGEVEARILEHPRVLAAAVIITPMPGTGKSLVAFYETGDGLTDDELRDHLREALPASSVPAQLVAIDRLPLNPNGKVDKKALIARAQALPTGAGTATVPSTPTELRLAAAWAAALNLPIDRIGGDDHFFEIGGASLSALRMVAELDGLITLPQLLTHPVLSELAAVVDKEAA